MGLSLDWSTGILTISATDIRYDGYTVEVAVKREITAYPERPLSDGTRYVHTYTVVRALLYLPPCKMTFEGVMSRIGKTPLTINLNAI